MTVNTNASYRDVVNAQQAEHGARVSRRNIVNGAPNGYRPVSEAELQAEKFAAEIEALEGDTTRRTVLANGRAA